MSRKRNKRVAVRVGSRLRVLTAEVPNMRMPKRWKLDLECGHVRMFVANEQPRSVACLFGCKQPPTGEKGRSE